MEKYLDENLKLALNMWMKYNHEDLWKRNGNDPTLVEEIIEIINKMCFERTMEK